MAVKQAISVERIAHSPLGASGSGRWMNCAGSIGLAAALGILSTPSTMAAKEGTAAHEILARCLQAAEPTEPWEYLGQEVIVEDSKFEVTQAMVDALTLCYNHIELDLKKAIQRGEVTTYIETSMKHSAHELMFGTTDCGIASLYTEEVTGERRCSIWVNDLKYGSGIVVEPTSSQIKYYAVLIIDRMIQEGAIQSFDQVDCVTLTIMQPRIPHEDGLIRSIEMTGPELYEWYTGRLVPAMKETENPDATLAVGDWCTFCPVKEKCPAMAQAMIDLSKALNPEKMTGAELGATLDKLKALLKLEERIKEIAYKRAMNGETIKGYKLVKKKANRRWRAEAELDLQLEYGEDAFEPKSLKSPAAVEKLPGGKAFVTQYAYTPQDVGTTLAPNSDARKATKPLMAMMDDESMSAEEEI